MSPTLSCELAIVGGGPAGLAAAIEARRFGLDTLLIEERPALGGQIFKQLPESFTAPSRILGDDYREGSRLIAEAHASGVRILLDSTVWGIWPPELRVTQRSSAALVIQAQQIILATGAYDRPVAFPGWTLPGVITAGGAQSLIKAQGVFPGRRILLAGSGPVVLAFSAQLHKLGANLVAVLEAAPALRPSSVMKLLRAWKDNTHLLVSGIEYRSYLQRKRIPFLSSHIVVAADGNDEVESATVAQVDADWHVLPGTERSLDVDTVCVGYGFVACTELSRQCGCRHQYDENLGGWVPLRDELMRTTVPGILSVGDGAGVRGSRVGLEEGRLAAAVAAAALRLEHRQSIQTSIRKALRRVRSREHFAAALRSVYRVQKGIYELCRPGTVVCRCEEVTMSEIESALAEGSHDANFVKAVTRAGMGNCQGRFCSKQIAAIVARASGLPIADIAGFTPRAPVKPTALVSVSSDTEFIP